MARQAAFDKFVEELVSAMNKGSITSKELAEDLGIDYECVNNWRKRAANPRLEQLTDISVALGMGGRPRGDGDPLHLLRRMGILPEAVSTDNLVDAAYRLRKLEAKLAQAVDRAADLGIRRGASLIVRAVCESEPKWAVAVWPAFEGPQECRMHVADRVDFRRLDGSDVSDKDVWSDQKLRDVLRATFAFPASAAPRWTDVDDRSSSCWSINHVGSPRAPDNGTTHPQLTSLAFVAFTHKSMVDEVASMTASAIGYGLTTTHDLAMEIYDYSLGTSNPDARRSIHQSLLKRPRARRAWSHFSAPDTERDNLLPMGDDCRDDVFYVWLREGDDLLQQAIERFSGAAPTAVPPLALMQRQRDAMSKQLEHFPHPGRLLIIDVDAQRSASRDERWTQSLFNVLAVVRALSDRELVTASFVQKVRAQVAPNREDTTAALMRWLKRNDWPRQATCR